MPEDTKSDEFTSAESGPQPETTSDKIEGDDVYLVTLVGEVGHVKEVDISNGVESINEMKELLFKKSEHLTEEAQKC